MTYLEQMLLRNMSTKDVQRTIGEVLQDAMGDCPPQDDFADEEDCLRARKAYAREVNGRISAVTTLMREHAWRTDR